MTQPEKETIAASDFRCDNCKEVFVKGRSDEEAQAELEDRHPGVTREDCAVVCEDCWRKMGFS